MNNVNSQPLLPGSWDQARLRISDLLRDYAVALNQAANLELFKGVDVAAAYTSGLTDHVIGVTGGPYTVTIPAAGSMLWRKVTVKRKDNGTATITVTPASGNVDGAASATLTAAYQSRTFWSDGTNWWLI